MSVESLREREQARWMGDTCTVRRATEVSDGAGGTTQTWADHLTGLKCRVERAGSADESLQGGQVTQEADVVVVVPHGSDVTVKDRIVHDGRTLEVEGRLSWTYQVNLRLACREV